MLKKFVFPIFLLIWGSNNLWASESESTQKIPEDLTKLSISELQGIKLSKVTSVTKKEQNLFDAPAAIYVITKEDIRRSTALNIPELLRMVPGLQVAQIDANKWAISSRGFNQRLSDKLLVLVDGRVVYSITFSGVFWDQIDYPLEDIERIEVIRGPGGTLWGANAVNGVINIITKNSKDTQGFHGKAIVGTVEEGSTTFRYGAKLNEKTTYRVYGKYFNRDSFEPRPGTLANDHWNQFRGGFRIDLKKSKNEEFTFQGDYYNGESSSRTSNTIVSLAPPSVRTFDAEGDIDGANILARWVKKHTSNSETQVQFFWNREHRQEPFLPEILVNTLDLQIQHRRRLFARHDVTIGFGQSYTFDEFKNAFNLQINPQTDFNFRIDGFIQDEITIVDKFLKFIVGSKFEHNSFSGFEFQPNARLVYTPNSKNTIWFAASRAVRTPNIVEERVFLLAGLVPTVPPTVISLQGVPNPVSEDLLSLELGYRWKALKNVVIDISTYLNFYNDLRSVELGSLDLSNFPTFVRQPTFVRKGFSGETYGMELSVFWNPFDWWTLKSGFSWFEMDLAPDPGLVTAPSVEGLDPSFQVQLRSTMNLPKNIELDTYLNFVDDIPQFNIPSYTRLDVRLGWRPVKNVSVSLGALNLLDPEHLEFQERSTAALVTSTEVPRSYFFAITINN